MKTTSLFLLAGITLALGCDGGDKDETGLEESDTDTDTDTDSDTDADTTPIPNKYTSFEGWESFDYNNGTYGKGEYNCQLVWNLSGTPINPMLEDCENCEFMFDVTYTLDTEFSYDDKDGTCLGGGDGSSFGAYGYSSEFEGYGGSWVTNYYGTYYWWGYGEFDGAQFKYTYGYVDYPYDYYGTTYILTYYQYGLIDVQ